MTALQDAFKGFVTVIVVYVAEQKRETVSVESFLNKNDLVERLAKYIEELPKAYQDRAPLLKYLLYIVKDLKPLVDKSTLLENDEYKKVQDVLVSLIIKIQSLMQLPNHETIDVQYNNETIPLLGFTRGVVTGIVRWGTQCRSSQLLQKAFLTPWEIGPKTPEKTVKEIVKKQVDAHQEFQKNHQAQTAGSLEITEVIEATEDPLIGEYQKLEEALLQTEKENRTLKEGNMELQDSLTQLKKDHRKLKQKFAEQQRAYEALQTEKTELDQTSEKSATAKEIPTTTAKDPQKDIFRPPQYPETTGLTSQARNAVRPGGFSFPLFSPHPFFAPNFEAQARRLLQEASTSSSTPTGLTPSPFSILPKGN